MAQLLSYALTTLADVKETLGITGTSQDNLLTRKINQATEIIIGYCNRRFDEQTNVVEYYDGRIEQQLLLRNRPITTTTTFKLEARDTSLNDNDFTTVPTDEYFIDREAGVIDGVASFVGSWDRWKVTYSYGYATIPSDVAEACVSIAGYLYNYDPANVAGIQSKEEGTRKLTFASKGSSSSSDDIISQLGLKTVLDRYTEIVISGQR